MEKKYIHVIIDHHNNAVGAFYNFNDAREEVRKHLKKYYKEYKEDYVNPTLTRFFSNDNLVRKIERIIIK